MASSNVQEEMQVLKDDVAKLRSDIAGLVDLFKELGLQKVNEARDTIEGELDEQREKLRAMFNSARERGKGTVDDLEQHVTEHPLGSVLTAFGIGYILARLLGGKS